MSQVFGCPNCNNPFQVPADAAGGTFECPSCRSNIEIPQTIGKKKQDDLNRDTRRERVHVFECPHCSEQFGLDPTAVATSVSCPHCDREVAVEEPEDDEVTPVFEEAKTDSNPSSDESDLRKDVVEDDAQTASTDSSDTTEQSVPAAFVPESIDDLLPPRFDVPDPIRFPTRRGSDEVILPDGEGGFQSVEANIVTMVHEGLVYRLKRLTPEQRYRRKLIHSGITIVVAIVLIYLTMRTIGLFS